jgi:hypothetical protein
LVGGRREAVGVVTQAEFEVAEELSVGGIDEFLGPAPQGRLGGGPQLVQEGLDTGLTIFGGR